MLPFLLVSVFQMVASSAPLYVYIFSSFGNIWLKTWHVSHLVSLGGPCDSGSLCNQCKGIPTFSTVCPSACLLYYCRFLCTILSNRLFHVQVLWAYAGSSWGYVLETLERSLPYLLLIWYDPTTGVLWWYWPLDMKPGRLLLWHNYIGNKNESMA